MCTLMPKSSAKAGLRVRSFAACTRSKYSDMSTRLSRSCSRSAEIPDRWWRASRPAPRDTANSIRLPAFPAETVASAIAQRDVVACDHVCDSWGHGQLPDRVSLYSHTPHHAEENDMSIATTTDTAAPQQPAA